MSTQNGILIKLSVNVKRSFDNKKLLVIMVALSVSLIIDTSLVKINDLIPKDFIPVQDKLVLFSINSAICMILQFIVIDFVMCLFGSDRVRKSNKIRSFYLICLTSYFVLTTMLGYLVYQQFNYQYYETWVNIIMVTMSYGSSSILILSLALLFLNWYRATRDLIVLLYFVSMSLISVHLIISVAFIDIKLNDVQPRVREFIGASGDVSHARHAFFEKIYDGSYLVSFFSIWITTAILMKSYREKLTHSVRFWMILILPLGYFLTANFYNSLSFLLSSFFRDDPVTTTLVVASFLSLSKPIGGLLFAVAFWNMSKLLGYEKKMRLSMIIAGCGIFFIFSANQANTQYVIPYPPFGATTLTLMNLASFLMLLGIFNSAALVSSNNSLREFIYKNTMNLLKPIGRAEMEKEIHNTVIKISREKEIEKTPEVSFDFDEEELKKYLKQVLKLKKDRTSK